MQYINGHAPQIGDMIENQTNRQRREVTAIPQAGVVRCGANNWYARDCLLLSRVQTQAYPGNGNYGQPPGTFGGVDYAGGYGQGFVDPGLEILEDILIVDAMVDLVEDIVDFGGGFGGDLF